MFRNIMRLENGNLHASQTKHFCEELNFVIAVDDVFLTNVSMLEGF
jgi:hypothetical protein